VNDVGDVMVIVLLYCATVMCCCGVLLWCAAVVCYRDVLL
jgi:hypothetical protein